MKIKKRKVKSVITKSNLPGADFVINPYIGCQHACKYCYADFMRRFTGHGNEEWGSFVDVKVNAPETIEPSKIKKDSLILIGSVTDPYQPLESKYELTKKCLERLLKNQPKLEILTKSPLILRDINLLQKFKNLRVGISVGVLDENYAKQLEPHVASPNKRLDILKKLHEAGISTYLFVSPIFPEISDVSRLIDLVKNYVGEILFENLNIRANNRGRILEFIEKNKPELRDLYKELSKNRAYWDIVEKEIMEKCKKEKIKCRIYFHHSKK